MKKVYQSFISILLVFSLLASMTLTSFATAKNNKVGDNNNDVQEYLFLAY